MMAKSVNTNSQDQYGERQDIRRWVYVLLHLRVERAENTRSRVRRRDRFSISSIQLADLGGTISADWNFNHHFRDRQRCIQERLR